MTKKWIFLVCGAVLQSCNSKNVGIVENAGLRDVSITEKFDIQDGLKEHQIIEGHKRVLYWREKIHGDRFVYVRKVTVEIDEAGACVADRMRVTTYPEEVARACFYRSDSIWGLNCRLKDGRIHLEFFARMKPLGTLFDPFIDTFLLTGTPRKKDLHDLNLWEGAYVDQP